MLLCCSEPFECCNLYAFVYGMNFVLPFLDAVVPLLHWHSRFPAGQLMIWMKSLLSSQLRVEHGTQCPDSLPPAGFTSPCVSLCPACASHILAHPSLAESQKMYNWEHLRESSVHACTYCNFVLCIMLCTVHGYVCLSSSAYLKDRLTPVKPADYGDVELWDRVASVLELLLCATEDCKPVMLHNNPWALVQNCGF